MDKQIRKESKLSAAVSLLLAFTLVFSSFMSMTAAVSYAESDAESSVLIDAEEGTVTDQDTENGTADDENGSENEKAVTHISNCETSYNKLISKTLKITADIYPAGGREVQLQRYSSADESWSVISTITVEETEPETEESASDETAADTEESPAEEAEAAEAEEPSTHISIAVPEEERNNTNSVWRLYVPATDEAEEAYSENITVVSRNLKRLDLSAKAACIYRIDGDSEGSLIYTKSADQKRAQASTTKLMTAILLLESGLIDKQTEISSHAANTPWGSGRLAAGDVYNNRDLLYAMLLPSANDAATAVAEGVGGSETEFVKMMNAKAEEMGFTDTHFCNPHGLDADEHYTTAAELAELTAYAYTFPEITDCWASSYKTIKSVRYGRKWTMWSTNAIIGYISNFLGGKTGTEDNAGCCFTGVYTYEGSTYITVVLGSGYGFSRWSDTKKLHQYIRDYAATSY